MLTSVPPPPAEESEDTEEELLRREAEENSQRQAAHLPPRPHAKVVRILGYEFEWRGFKDLLIHHVLHLDDTPHRIAMGVFLGFFIGATPTIGIQVALYWIVAQFIGANKLSGLGPIWLSNPVTAAPLYYGEWQFGHLLMTGRFGSNEVFLSLLVRLSPHEGQSWLSRMFDPDMWMGLFEGMMALGGILWIGSIVCGALAGLIGYWATFRAVNAYRLRRHP